MGHDPSPKKKLVRISARNSLKRVLHRFTRNIFIAQDRLCQLRERNPINKDPGINHFFQSGSETFKLNFQIGLRCLNCFVKGKFQINQIDECEFSPGEWEEGISRNIIRTNTVGQ